LRQGLILKKAGAYYALCRTNASSFCRKHASSILWRFSTSASENENSKNDRVETIYNLGKCVSDRKGVIIFVENDDAYYECDGTSWISDKETSSSSKDEEKNKSSSSVDAKSSSSSEAYASSSSSSEPQSSASNDSSKEDDSCSSEAEEYSSSATSSSTEEIQPSSSSVESSSSEALSNSSQSPPPVMPLGTYDCSRYTCSSTEYLNQELLAKGEYGEILDIRNKHVYNTIKIGEQTWMAQNLDFMYKIYRDGERVVFGNGCYEGNEVCDESGRWYTWPAAVDSAAVYSTTMQGAGYGNTINFWVYAPKYNQQNPQGVCPNGWHLPTKQNYEELFEFVGGMETAGLHLKSADGWIDSDYREEKDYGGKNIYGLSILPGCLWTSTLVKMYPCDAFCVYFSTDHTAEFYSMVKFHNQFVRCMMNSPREESN